VKTQPVRRPALLARAHSQLVKLRETERFLILFERARFIHNEWRFSEWGKLPVCLPLSPKSKHERVGAPSVVKLRVLPLAVKSFFAGMPYRSAFLSISRSSGEK